MSQARRETVVAVQTSILEILDLVAEIEVFQKSENTDLRSEVENTLLRFIAATIVADGSYSTEEEEFISVLVNTAEKPGGSVRYLNEFAAKWRETYPNVPAFFEASISYDLATESNSSNRIIQLIQLIGLNVCACDSRYGRAERKIVEKYILFLNDHASNKKARQ